MPRRKLTMLTAESWSEQSASAQSGLDRARDAYRKKVGIATPLIDLWCGEHEQEDSRRKVRPTVYRVEGIN